MIPKLVHSLESTNTIGKFIIISFLSKSQNHETTEANTRAYEDILGQNISPNDQTPKNNISPTNSTDDNISMIHTSFQPSSNHPFEPDNSIHETQNRVLNIPQPTPQPISTRPMITRVQVGICKPKTFNTQKTLSLDTPLSVVEELTDKN